MTSSSNCNFIKNQCDVDDLKKWGNTPLRTHKRLTKFYNDYIYKARDLGIESYLNYGSLFIDGEVTDYFTNNNNSNGFKIEINKDGFLEYRNLQLNILFAIYAQRDGCGRDNPGLYRTVKHLDGNKLNNNISNLIWWQKKLTKSEKKAYNRFINDNSDDSD